MSTLSFNEFLGEGKREQDKINNLLDIMQRRELTADEKELLVSLSKGNTLPDEPPPTLKKHKTGGGYMFDDEGNIMTEEEPKLKPGKEFTTTRGKMRSVDKLDIEEEIDARVYRNKDNEERFIYSHVTLNTGGITYEWIIYRTGGGSEYKGASLPGQFMNTNTDKSPEVLWKQLDHRFDYGMALDEDIYEDFMNFVQLYKEKERRNNNIVNRLYDRFCKII